MSIKLTVATEGFESSLEVPEDCTKEQFDEFAKQWLKMMHTALQVVQSRKEVKGSAQVDAKGITKK